MSETADNATTEQPDQPKLTREEQNAKLMPALRKSVQDLMEVGVMYQKAYPVGTTPSEVVNAVTVAVPLRHFMVLLGFASNIVAGVMETEKVVNPPKAETQQEPATA